MMENLMENDVPDWVAVEQAREAAMPLVDGEAEGAYDVLQAELAGALTAARNLAELAGDRTTSIVITKLEEAELWLTKVKP